MVWQLWLNEYVMLYIYTCYVNGPLSSKTNVNRYWKKHLPSHHTLPFYTTSLITAAEAGTRLSNPGGMQGWVMFLIYLSLACSYVYFFAKSILFCSTLGTMRMVSEIRGLVRCSWLPVCSAQHESRLATDSSSRSVVSWRMPCKCCVYMSSCTTTRLRRISSTDANRRASSDVADELDSCCCWCCSGV